MVRANLVAETDSGSVADSMGGIFEGIISLDLHHDVNSDVPGSISMRFVMLRKSGRWCPSLPTAHPKTRRTIPIERLRELPSDLHDAITFPSLTVQTHSHSGRGWKARTRGRRSRLANERDRKGMIARALARVMPRVRLPENSRPPQPLDWCHRTIVTHVSQPRKTTRASYTCAGRANTT